MYDILEVAATIVEECVERGHPINSRQLQKMLYYTQVMFIKTYRGKLCFEDEFCRTYYGAINIEVLDAYRQYFSQPILKPPLKQELELTEDFEFKANKVPYQTIQSLTHRRLVQIAIEKCMPYSTFQLEKLNGQEVAVQSTGINKIISNVRLYGCTKRHPSVV